MVGPVLLAIALASVVSAPVEPISLRAIVEITDISSLAVSPDGRTLVFRAETASLARNDYDLGWYAVPVDGSAPARRIASAGSGDWQDGTLLSESPRWTADSSAILYRATINGLVQLWRAAVDGRHTEQISQDPGNISGFVVDSAGNRLTFAAGAAREDIVRAEEAEYDGGVRIDASVDPLRQLYRGATIDGRLASERLHGRWFGHGGLLADKPPRYQTLDLATLAVRDASEIEQARIAAPAQPFATRDGRIIVARADAGDPRGTAYVLANGLHESLMIARSDGAGTVTTCNRPICRDRHIVAVSWQPDTNRVLFTTSDTSTNQSLQLWNIDTGDVRTVTVATGRLNGGRDDRDGCALTARAAICVAASANVPPHLVKIALDSGHITTLAAPNTNLVHPGQPAFKALTWSDPDGNRFTGQLMLPPGATAPVPLFVTYYVCDGYLRGGTGDEFPLRQLVAHGIAALCINRLPVAPGPGDQVHQYRLAQGGVTSAVALLVGRGLVDPQRVGMGGLSFGGEVTMWVATHSNVLAAMSVSNIMLSPAYYWFSAMAGREIPDVLKMVWGIGAPDVDPARWQEIAPTQNTKAIRAPLLMQMAEQEYRANMELAARLSRSETPVDLWAFPYETHVKFQPRHKLAVYERNLDWFRYWLQGAVDPDPLKQAQYRHWQTFVRKPGWHHDAESASVAARPSSQARTQASVSAIGSTK